MSHRQALFAVLEGQRPAQMPFFPDITDWYVAQRTPPGEERPFHAGQFISDAEPFHRRPGRMAPPYQGYTLADFYRTFDWGLFVHHYDWCDTVYTGPVECIVQQEAGRRVTTLHTPRGDLTHLDLLAMDGTWCPREHYVKQLSDLEIMALVVEHTQFVPHNERVVAAMQEMGDRGAGDIVLARSPFGKLVHNYMGFERVIYALTDAPQVIDDFMALQEGKDLELVALAAEAPERLVILSDHADENLIAPPYYVKYCIPYYQKIAAILHARGKFVSTHLDGNFHGFFPYLGLTGFDLLDGCTPAPMFNYEVEELAAALPEGMSAFCGAPATLFCQGLPTEEILAFGDRIRRALRGRAILNVGDILPPNGDIEQVIALGRHAQTTMV